MSDFEETIAAIATPLGEGGVGIVRLSGKQALSVANALFSKDVFGFASHSAHLGVVVDQEGCRVDDALLLLMLAPHSYTGEDVVELQCHGGFVAVSSVLQAALDAGARLAHPGEFTYRAFVNGKLDLTQAEAVQQLIGAKSERAFALASKHLEGALSKKISTLQISLSEIAAIVEAWVDFPEEGLEFASKEELISALEKNSQSMDALIKTFHEGQKIEKGISLCIVGAPNVGKSSLMNALLKHDRAIVTDIAGTTRDLLQEELILNGLHFRLIDTAGIRSAIDPIEKEGIERAKKAMHEAEILLVVLDATRELSSEESLFLKEVSPKKTLLIWNKQDLVSSPPKSIAHFPNLFVSAKCQTGLDDLSRAIEKHVFQGKVADSDEVLLSSYRHKEALELAKNECDAVLNGLKNGVSPEFLTFDLRASLKALGKIIGTDVTEDILSAIFSKFCIGK